MYCEHDDCKCGKEAVVRCKPKSLGTIYDAWYYLCLRHFIDWRANKEDSIWEHLSDVFNETDQDQEGTNETVNHPQHYGGADNPYEAIKVIEAWELGFHLGNTVKYIARCGKKNPDQLEDLLKAQWYLNRKIENLKKAEIAKTTEG